MSFQPTYRTLRLLLGSLAVVVVWLACGGNLLGNAGQVATAPVGTEAPTAAQKSPAERPADSAAVRKALEGFSTVFQKGDAKAVAALWTAEGEGGIGDADITRNGKTWMFAARVSTSDGRVLTAANIMTPVDVDSFLWQVVEQTLDDEELPELAPVKVTRMKAKT